MCEFKRKDFNHIQTCAFEGLGFQHQTQKPMFKIHLHICQTTIVVFREIVSPNACAYWDPGLLKLGPKFSSSLEIIGGAFEICRGFDSLALVGTPLGNPGSTSVPWGAGQKDLRP